MTVVQCVLGIVAFGTGVTCEENVDNFALRVGMAAISGLCPILTAFFWFRSFESKQNSVLPWVFFTVLSCVLFACRVCGTCGESMVLSCLLEFLCTTVQLTLMDFKSMESCLP